MLFYKMLKQISPVMSKIYNHPFNQGLYNGNLPRTAFYDFLRQDKIYLYEFSRVLKKVAHKVEDETDKNIFLKLSYNAYKTQDNLHNKYLKPQEFSFFKDKQDNAKILPIVQEYINFLHNIADNFPVELSIASCIPCFYIYSHLGLHMQKLGVNRENPYALWIDSYSGRNFVLSKILIIETFKKKTLNTMQLEDNIINAFKKSIDYEMTFWTHVLGNDTQHQNDYSLKI